MTTVTESFADELVASGVEVLYSLPASETMRILVAAEARGIKVFTARHEQAAVGMADGYARITGKVGVVLVGRGPGFTNGLNSLVNAVRGKSRVVIVSGERPSAFEASDDPDVGRKSLFASKEFDQAGLLELAGASTVFIDSAETARADFREALDHAARGNTVGVLLRTDIAKELAGDSASTLSLGSGSAASGAAAPAEDIAAVADLLQETWAVKRPLIIAGRGAVDAGARDELLRLGECTGALLGTTLLGRQFFEGQPYDLGVVGTFSTSVGSELIMASDVVLVFGASLNLYTTYGGHLLRDKHIVQIDSDPEALGFHLDADIAIVGDAREVARQLTDELQSRGHAFVGWRDDATAEKLAAYDARSEIDDRSGESGLDPRTLMAHLETVLPSERALVIDSGAHLAFDCAYITVRDPKDFIFPLDYSSVGAGQGIAIGAAIADSTRLTVLCIGDGGLMMTLQDLDTIVRYDLPVAVIVVNDRALGQEVHLLRMDGLPGEIAMYENPSFASVASALGMEALTVRTPEELAEVGPWVAGKRGPYLIDCHTTLDVRADVVGLVSALGHGDRGAQPAVSSAAIESDSVA